MCCWPVRSAWSSSFMARECVCEGIRRCLSRMLSNRPLSHGRCQRPHSPGSPLVGSRSDRQGCFPSCRMACLSEQSQLRSWFAGPRCRAPTVSATSGA
jgi:hypothetical protein